MGNCQTERLLGTVDNNNLAKLGMMRFDVKNTSAVIEFGTDYNEKYNITMDGVKTFSVRTAGGVWLAQNVTSYEVNQGNYTTIEIRVFSAIGTVWIDNKYKFRKLTIKWDDYNFDLSQVQYSPILGFTLTGTSDVKYTTNDIDMIALQEYKDYTYNIVGELKDFALASNLYIFTGGGSISGDILELAQAQVKAGRESATINGTGWSRKFNGVEIGSYSNYQIAWVKSGNNYVVTCKAGTTIESPSFNQSVTIDAQGNIVS